MTAPERCRLCGAAAIGAIQGLPYCGKPVCISAVTQKALAPATTAIRAGLGFEIDLARGGTL